MLSEIVLTPPPVAQTIKLSGHEGQPSGHSPKHSAVAMSKWGWVPLHLTTTRWWTTCSLPGVYTGSNCKRKIKTALVLPYGCSMRGFFFFLVLSCSLSYLYVWWILSGIVITSLERGGWGLVHLLFLGLWRRDITKPSLYSNILKNVPSKNIKIFR